jgi:hypothetical protein
MYGKLNKTDCCAAHKMNSDLKGTILNGSLTDGITVEGRSIESQQNAEYNRTRNNIRSGIFGFGDGGFFWAVSHLLFSELAIVGVTIIRPYDCWWEERHE